MDVPLRPETPIGGEPSGHDIEEEFGVRILGPGELSATGWWYAKIPGTRFWVEGRSLADLRNNLIASKWLADYEQQAGR